MTSKAEGSGAALAKAVKAAAGITSAALGGMMYRTNIRDVPKELKRQDGWINMQVQFLIDENTASAGTPSSAGPCSTPAPATSGIYLATVDEFFVLKGKGHII